MADLNSDKGSMSESIEMYLLRITLLQKKDQPVSIPVLAQELAVSPVSANEMCRKLTERGLVHYEPYKGVILTPQGEALARRVLRHRRLWEVFFVEKLGIEAHEAETMACRFEHVTPVELAGRLASFLGNPLLSPQNEPIPHGESISIERPVQPLSALGAGEQGQAAQIEADETTQEFLRHQGIVPGILIEVLAVARDGSVLVEVESQHLSLSAAIAGSVAVVPVELNESSALLSQMKGE